LTRESGGGKSRLPNFIDKHLERGYYETKSLALHRFAIVERTVSESYARIKSRVGQGKEKCLEPMVQAKEET